MPDQTLVPTAEHAAQAQLAEADVMELLSRFDREGFDHRAVLAAMTSALACLVGTLHGLPQVPAWFEQAARNSAHLRAEG